MKINEMKTSELDMLLNQTDLKQLDEYLEAHTLDETETFAEYLSAIIRASRQKKKDVIARAGLSEQYGYRLLNGQKITKNRDKILGICIAAGLDIRHTDRALKLSGFSPLYSKVDRDAVIMICINRGMHSVLSVNEELERRGMPILNLTE